MPRPSKKRRICSEPLCSYFAPKDSSKQHYESVIMTLDEYQTILLIDYQNITQEQCATKMNVARTTVQAIYSSARSKIAECLVKGKELHIEGGNYFLCNRVDVCSDCNKLKSLDENKENEKRNNYENSNNV